MTYLGLPETLIGSKVAASCLAQSPEMTQSIYVDPKTGINFTTWSQPPQSNGHGAFTFGLAVPADATTKDATEYIGLLVCSLCYSSHRLSPRLSPPPAA